MLMQQEQLVVEIAQIYLAEQVLIKVLLILQYFTLQLMVKFLITKELIFPESQSVMVKLITEHFPKEHLASNFTEISTILSYFLLHNSQEFNPTSGPFMAAYWYFVR